MKVRNLVLIVWALIAVLYGTPTHAENRPPDDNSAATVPGDASVTAEKMAADDFSDFSCNGLGVCTIDRWAPVFLDICPSGNTAAGQCAVMTSQGAGPNQVGGVAATKRWDMLKYTQFRLYVHMGGTGATTMDVALECDSTVQFNTTPTTMISLTQADLGASVFAASAWTSFAVDECHLDDMYYRIVATGGNGAESPVIRQIYVGLR